MTDIRKSQFSEERIIGFLNQAEAATGTCVKGDAAPTHMDTAAHRRKEFIRRLANRLP
jgi:hypothetical protein